LLRRLNPHAGSDFVFTHTGARSAAGNFARYKRQLDEALEKAGAGALKFRLHDFRRTLVMRAQERDADFYFDASHVANRCLGHETFDPVRKTYNPYSFGKERRILLTAWANDLASEEAQEYGEATEVLQLEGPKTEPEPELSDQVRPKHLLLMNPEAGVSCDLPRGPDVDGHGGLRSDPNLQRALEVRAHV
jgi:hypothetical protein